MDIPPDLLLHGFCGRGDVPGVLQLRAGDCAGGGATDLYWADEHDFGGQRPGADHRGVPAGEDVVPAVVWADGSGALGGGAGGGEAAEPEGEGNR